MELLVLLVLQSGSPYILEGVCHHGMLVIPTVVLLCIDFLLSISLFGQTCVHCCHVRCQARTDYVAQAICLAFLFPRGFSACFFPLYSIVFVSQLSSETIITFLKLS